MPPTGVVWTATRELDQAWAEKVLASIKIVDAPKRGPRLQADTARPFLTDFEQDNQWRDLQTVPVR